MAGRRPGHLATRRLKIPVDRRPRLVAARIGFQFLFDDLGLLARLNDVPADPENQPEKDQELFRALEGIDGSDVLQITRPAR